MMKKVATLTHCCKDCLMRSSKKPYRCDIKDPHFHKQLIGKINDCPNWQN